MYHIWRLDQAVPCPLDGLEVDAVQHLPVSVFSDMLEKALWLALSDQISQHLMSFNIDIDGFPGRKISRVKVIVKASNPA